MKKSTTLFATVVLLAGVAAGFYFWQKAPTTQPQMMQSAVPPPPPPVQVEPQTHFPLPELAQEEAKPLPELKDSDADVWKALADLFGNASMKQYFHPQEIVRRIVVTIDNLPRKVVAARLLPNKPVPGNFRTSGSGDDLVIAPDNSARYTPYVRLLEMADAKKLGAVYVRFYPLFQTAYQDLGYPNGYFNDRLVAVIDHMLGAPEIEGPVALVQPHVLYKYKDPELEASSAGHKLMLRMGSENEERVKVKLREIRKVVTSQKLGE